MIKLSQYSKSIAAVIGATLTAVLTYYPHANWEPIVAAVLTALTVYAVPNTGSATSNTTIKETGSS